MRPEVHHGPHRREAEADREAQEAREKRAARKPAPVVAAPWLPWTRSCPRVRFPALRCPARPRQQPQRQRPLTPAAAVTRRHRSKPWQNKKADVRSLLPAAHRRRQGHRDQEAVFPAQEGVPVLRREDRRHQLQRHQAAERVHLRARQDHAPPHLGRVRSAPAAAGRSDQAGAQHRAAAVRGAGLREEQRWKSFLEKTSKSSDTAARW